MLEDLWVRFPVWQSTVMSTKRSKKTRRRARRKYNLSSQRNYSSYESPSITFLDPLKYVTLKYMQSFTSSLATTVGAQQVMNLNSIFDPDETNATGAHQPYGYDQLSLLYTRYRVMKTRYTVQFSPAAGTYHSVVVPSNNALGATISDQVTFQGAAETPRARMNTVAASGQARRVTGAIALNALNGSTVTEYKASDRTQAAIGANPTEDMFLVLGIYNPGAATISVNYSVILMYEVMLYDPVMLAQS